MERIQLAIEKARARRLGAQPATPAARPKLAPQAAGPDAVEMAWQAIAEFAPSPKTMEHHRVFTYSGGPDAAPFDMLRTKILQQMRANNWRRLAITSPGSSCGKTTICTNLAFGLARQSGMRTAVIEMDMRRPALARTLGLGSDMRQFSTALSGDAPARDHMLRYGTNLVFGINHKATRNPSELLHSEQSAKVLDEIEQSLGLSLMIFDMPPMMSSDDMLAFTGKIDCALLVAAAERTTVKEIDSCERDLAEQTNVLGVVLNKCRYVDASYGYGYGYD